MAEEFIPEGFELVDKEEKKEKEIIPGFETVEKQEVVATDAAPAATEDQVADNMSSESVDILSVLSPENLGKKPKKVKRRDKKKIKAQQDFFEPTYTTPPMVPNYSAGGTYMSNPLYKKPEDRMFDEYFTQKKPKPYRILDELDLSQVKDVKGEGDVSFINSFLPEEIVVPENNSVNRIFKIETPKSEKNSKEGNIIDFVDDGPLEEYVGEKGLIRQTESYVVEFVDNEGKKSYDRIEKPIEYLDNVVDRVQLNVMNDQEADPLNKQNLENKLREAGLWDTNRDVSDLEVDIASAQQIEGVEVTVKNMPKLDISKIDNEIKAYEESLAEWKQAGEKQKQEIKNIKLLAKEENRSLTESEKTSIKEYNNEIKRGKEQIEDIQNILAIKGTQKTRAIVNSDNVMDLIDIEEKLRIPNAINIVGKDKHGGAFRRITTYTMPDGSEIETDKDQYDAYYKWYKKTGQKFQGYFKDVLDKIKEKSYYLTTEGGKGKGRINVGGKNIAQGINNKFLVHGIGADVGKVKLIEGGGRNVVRIVKNPVFKKDGTIDIIKTAHKNGLTTTETVYENLSYNPMTLSGALNITELGFDAAYDQLANLVTGLEQSPERVAMNTVAENLQENIRDLTEEELKSQLVEKGLMYYYDAKGQNAGVTLPGGFDVGEPSKEDYLKMTQWVQANAGDFRNVSVSDGLPALIDLRNTKLNWDNEFNQIRNATKKELNTYNALTKKSEKKFPKVQEAADKLSAELKAINLNVQEVNDKVVVLDEEITVLEENLAAEPSEENLKLLEDKVNERDKIVKDYEKEFGNKAGDFYKLREKTQKLYAQSAEISGDIQDSLSSLNTMAQLSNVLQYSTGQLLTEKGKVAELYQGRGSWVEGIVASGGEMLAKVNAGRITVFSEIAGGFNELGRLTGAISEGEYKYNKEIMAAQRKSLPQEAMAAASVFRSKDMDDEWYNAWRESTIGGALDNLTRMAVGAFGAPVTGMFGGYFLSSLADIEAQQIEMGNYYVNNLMEEEGISRQEAEKRWSKEWTKGDQKLHAYTRAAAEGAFAWMSGKILGGGGKITKQYATALSNKVLAQLSKGTGKFTVKDIQLAVQKQIGDISARALNMVATGAAVGFEEAVQETLELILMNEYDKHMPVPKVGDGRFDFKSMEYGSEEFKKQWWQTVKVAFLSGSSVGFFKTAIKNPKLKLNEYQKADRTSRRKMDEFYDEMFTNSANPENLGIILTEIENKFNEGVISETELKKQRQLAELTYKISTEIQANPKLKGVAKAEQFQLLREKYNLESKKASLPENSPTINKIDETIKAIDSRVEAITNDSNNIAPKSTIAQEAKNAIAKSGQVVLDARIAGDNKAIEEQLREIAAQNNYTKEETEQFIEENLIPDQDFEVEVFDDLDFKEVAEKYNIDPLQLVGPDGQLKTEGIYLPNKGVMIISKSASEDVDLHETSHMFLERALEDPNNEGATQAMADIVLDEVSKQDPEGAKALEEQVKSYDQKERAEEILTYYIQLRKKGYFKKDKTAKDKIAYYARRLMQNTGLTMNVTEDNVIQFLNDWADSASKGKLTKAQKKAAAGDINIDIKTKPGKVIDINQQVTEDIDEQQPIAAAKPIKKAKPISVDTKSMSNAFDQNITEELVTNEDFKNSDAAVDAYTAIESNPQFNSYVNQLINRDANLQGLDSEVKQEVNRKIKENLQLRALNNFKPVVDGNRRSLFSYLYGKADQRGLGGIAQKALLDVKKEYATRADAGAMSTDVTDSEGRSFDIADTSTDIIEDVDRGVAEAPRSTFRRNIVRGNEKGLTPQEVKSFKEVTQPIVDKLPPVDDKKYRTKVDQVSGKELKSWVKDNVLKGQDYKTFIKDNYNNIRDLDLKYLIELDKGLMKQGKERMFTKPNRRLTTQADIRKYRDSGRAFVENEAQGVMLYDILDPGADAVVDFYTNQTPQNVSNRKGKFMEAIGKKMFKDVLPETRVQRGDTDQVKATSARKTQVQPTLKFAKPIEKDIVDSGIDQMVYEDYMSDQKFWSKFSEDVGGKNYNFNDPKQLEEWKQKEFPKLVKIFPKDFILNSGAFYGYRGFPFRDNNPTKVSKEGKLQPEHRKAFEKYLNEKFPNDSDYGPPIKNLDIALEKIGQKSKKFNSYFGSEQNIKNNKIKEEVLKEIFLRIQNADGNIIPAAVGMLRTTPAEQAHFMRKIAPVTFRQLGIEKLSSGQITEEHALGASLVAKQSLLLASDNVVDDNFTGITRNYFQGPISKVNDDKVNAKELGMKEGPQKEDLYRVLIGEMSGWIRYAKTPGFNLNNIQILDNKGNKILLTDFYNVGVDNKYKNMPNVIAQQNSLIVDQIANGLDAKTANQRIKEYVDNLSVEQNKANKSNYAEMKQSKVLNVNEEMDMETLLSKAASIDEALRLANSLDQPVKKIRVFDFDDTLATSNNIVIATSPDGKSRNLNAEQFAKEGLELKEQGWTMDFSDFNKVTDGGRGPLFDIAKKIEEARGNEDLFVLTARAPQSADAIYEFLKAEGLEFKRENIIGLGNSTGEAKANWIVDKAAEGYNDFYFADDAYQNVKAVRDALGVIDVKSKVQQARIKQSKKLDIQFNKLLEETTGVEFFKEYSPAKAKTIGASKGKFKFFIPHSAEDFLGLIYPTLGKGKLGDRQMAWYKKHLLDPYTKAQESLSAARLNLMNDFKQLKKSLDVPKDLRKKNSTGMTNEQAVRVYLFQSMGYEVPGLSKTDLKELQSVVEKNPKLKVFADQILSITKGDGYSKPRPEWLTGTITTDLIDLINTEKRSKYLADWQQNVDAIYSKENLNKLEAIYGSKYREALEGILRRMKSGRNRLDTGNRLSNKVLDYINGSIGTIMFFNTRSAVLQTISSINFINWNFNNPIRAGAAFANQKQYWSDFVKLMNSDYLKDRRNGLKLNISESEIADAAATSKNKAKAAINYILQKGYLPTQYADSFAIASGGATFYRNRIKDLMKNNGMTEADAEAQALIEWRQVAEESQQSSDPSRISAQQSSDLGRIILAFANTPMQYARIQKRAIQDLANGRGDAKTHISKIIYYGFIQNVIFNALQQAVFALGFGDDDEEEDENKQKKYLNTANGMLDSLLRGLGIAGQAVSVGKNFLMDIYERSGRKRPEYVDAVWKLTQFSPPISSKISKLKQAAWHFDSKKRRQVIFEKGFALDNPAYEAFAKVVSATVNVPLDRLFYKMKNIEGALNEDNDLWQRIAMLAGWPEWQLKDKAKEPEATPEQKEKAKASKAVENYKAAKGSTDYDTLKKLTAAQQIKMLKGLGYGEYTIKNAKSEKAKIDLIIHKNSGGKIKVDKKAEDTAKYKALNKAEQVAKLDSLGLSSDEIKALKYENDRVEKLLELMK